MAVQLIPVARCASFVAQHLPPRRIMSLGRLLVEKHSKIAAVVFPVSLLGGYAYTMKTGTSPLADGKDWLQGVHG